MSDREDRLRSLLNKVRAKRPEDRTTRAADALERIRTASGTTVAAATSSSAPLPAEPSQPVAAEPSQPVAVPSALPTQVPSSPLPEPSTSPAIESPTRYSSQPPRVERPLSIEPRARSVRPSSGAPVAGSQPAVAPQSRRPEAIRAQSVAPTGQPVVYATDQPEFPRPKTFGDLLELTLSLRPR
ncbi:MAG: hypothetical protein EP303_01820 [Deltaproteobacteria bacterium]|nr:MAG: hypothetical protein EP303_01820 [Deltaproteobacteria bacterium]